MRVVRFMARFSEGKKQKSKNLFTLLDSLGKFSEGLGVKRAFFPRVRKISKSFVNGGEEGGGVY